MAVVDAEVCDGIQANNRAVLAQQHSAPLVSSHRYTRSGTASRAIYSDILDFGCRVLDTIPLWRFMGLPFGLNFSPRWPDRDMSARTQPQCSYDHRLKELVRTSGDLSVATELGIPRSTALGWLRDSPGEVVTLDILSLKEQSSA